MSEKIDALGWLQKTHPELALKTEFDRHWLWLIGDFSDQRFEGLRASLRGFGFRFAPRGHNMPSGRVAHWGHNCGVPTRMRQKWHRKWRGKSVNGNPKMGEKPEEAIAALLRQVGAI